MNNKIIGLIAFSATAIGVLAWVFTDGSIPGGFLNFISGPSFILVVGMGGGMAYMRKHTLNGNEFGKALKEDFILAGWIGFMMGIVLIGAGMDADTNLGNLGRGFGAATITVIYGYLLAAIAESFITTS